MVDLIDQQRHAALGQRRRQPCDLRARHHRSAGIVRRVDHHPGGVAIDQRQDRIHILRKAGLTGQRIVLRPQSPGLRHRRIGRIARIGHQHMRARPRREAEEDRQRLRRSGGDHHPVSFAVMKGGDRRAQGRAPLGRGIAQHGVVDRQRRVAQRADIRHAPARPRARRQIIGDRRRREIIGRQPMVEGKGRQVHGTTPRSGRQLRQPPRGGKDRLRSAGPIAPPAAPRRRAG